MSALGIQATGVDIMAAAGYAYDVKSAAIFMLVLAVVLSGLVIATSQSEPATGLV